MPAFHWYTAHSALFSEIDANEKNREKTGSEGKRGARWDVSWFFGVMRKRVAVNSTSPALRLTLFSKDRFMTSGCRHVLLHILNLLCIS